MSSKAKGYLFSFFGLWSGLIIISVAFVVMFAIIGSSVSNTFCGSANCQSFGDSFESTFGGAVVGFLLSLLITFIGLIVVIPTSVYVFLRVGGLRQRALRNSVYLGLLLLTTPIISWLILASDNNQVNQPLVDNRVLLTIIFAILWTHVVVYVARSLTLVGQKPN